MSTGGRQSSPVSRTISQLVRRCLEAQILIHLLRIAVSLLFLPLDNSVLVVALALSHISPFLPWLATLSHRQDILRDVRFRPKTILVTGIETPHGLHVARCFYREGHRVVGVAITETSFPSGESLSRALVSYFRITKLDYVSRLLDIVQREKADIWIPCSQTFSEAEDAVAKEKIEGQTSCRCFTMGPELASQWIQSDDFVQYMIKQGLPVVENHQVSLFTGS